MTSRVRTPPPAGLALAVTLALFLALALTSTPAASRDDHLAPVRLAEPTAAGIAAAVEALAAPVALAGVAPGFVVGWAEGGTVGTAGFGTFAADDPRVPGGDTLWEIGSVSKVFTAVLLAEAERRGLLALDDPVTDHLPPGLTLVPGEGGPIRVVDLSTHASGLPRMPGNFRPGDAADPYADYTVADLAEFLAEHEPRRAPGEAYEYSNLAVGLLGTLLVHVASQQEGGPRSYEELLVRWICDPLELHDTRVTLRANQPGATWGEPDPSLEARMTPPHDADGEPRHRWHFDALAGAGGIRSSANDLLRFGRAFLGVPGVTGAGASEAARALRPALLDTLMPRSTLDHTTVALGWHVLRDGSVWTHSGQTGGYRTLLLIEPEAERVVVSINNGSSGAPELLGWRLLELLEHGEADPPAPRRPLALGTEELDEYVGDYAILPGMGFRITREGERLRCRMTGQPAVFIYAETRDRFFYRVVPAVVEFERDEHGRPVALTLTQDGVVTEAQRVEPPGTGDRDTVRTEGRGR